MIAERFFYRSFRFYYQKAVNMLTEGATGLKSEL